MELFRVILRVRVIFQLSESELLMFCLGHISMAELHCIDLASSDLDGLASQLRQACLDTGFFYVVNHGISAEFLDQVFDESRKFFRLPMEDKLKVLQDHNNRGYTPLNEEKLDPAKQSTGDVKEGYYIGTEISEGDPRAKDPLQGPNQWPSPGLLPDWRHTMYKYFNEALNLSRKLITLIALALRLDANFFDSMFDNPLAVVRLLHYPAEVSKPELGIYGAGAHSDYGMLTLLASDGVGGLQICKDKNAKVQEWKDVAPVNGAFVVNLGDMLERWTNGLFRSTLHRVINPGLERYSIAFFMEPNFDCLVECLPTCHDEVNPPRYPPIKSGDHLLGKYRATHQGFDADAKLHRGPQ